MLKVYRVQRGTATPFLVHLHYERGRSAMKTRLALLVGILIITAPTASWV